MTDRRPYSLEPSRRDALRTGAGAAALLALPWRARAEEEAPADRHGLAMHGEPALPPGFPHLPYARPDAPKGGRLTCGRLGSFETVNPYAYKGSPAEGLRGYVYESLLARNYDEPFSLYGLVAQTVELPDDRSRVTFTIDPRARFSDGEDITADDVLFTFELLRERGHPTFRANYRRVKAASAENARRVRFELTGDDRELPLILGLMPVLPQHAVDAASFEATTFQPLTGSGPYVVSNVEPGRSLTFRRDPGYWGSNLAVNRGLNNFDEIRYDYYRDANSMFEAFKKGLIDVRDERDPLRWTTGYDFPAVRRGDVVKESFDSGVPAGMNAFVFNTRKPVFADVRVREALGFLFDYVWIDRNMFGGATARTRSYFEGSELASTGLPADGRERELLAPYPGVVREDILAGEWAPAESDGSGRDRDRLREALAMFEAAGWKIERGELRNAAREQMRFEILVSNKEQERISLAFARGLERAGVKAVVRLVDSVQAFRRMQTYDYDMIIYNWYASLSPGMEQRKFWGSSAADTPGERNYMGAKQPAIDAMIDALIAARDREEFVSCVRALDRALLSGFYVVPLFHVEKTWMARWKAIDHPQTTSLFGPTLETWWRVPAPTG